MVKMFEEWLHYRRCKKEYKRQQEIHTPNLDAVYANFRTWKDTMEELIKQKENK